jgi:hypothetical protein
MMMNNDKNIGPQASSSQAECKYARGWREWSWWFRAEIDHNKRASFGVPDE